MSEFNSSVSLDDLTIYKKVDSGYMLGQLYGLSEQCQLAWDTALEFNLPQDYKDINKVVILGMGGSAIGADLLRTFMRKIKQPQIFISRNYDLPAFVDERTLLIASSYSGNTEETISAFNQGLAINCKKLVMTTNGKLKSLAESNSIPVFIIEHKSSPRAAIGYSFFPLIAFMKNLGFLEGIDFDLNGTVNILKTLLEKWNERVPEQNNLPKRIALNLFGKIVVIYSADYLSEVGHRWKTQINENSKAWSFYETLPELNHNSVVGYQFPSELSSHIFVVFIRSLNMNQRLLVRYQITAEILQQNNIGFVIVDAFGEDELSHIMSLVYLGDWVSYYLAMLYQVDPTPVTVIDYLKSKLSQVHGGLL